MPNLINTPCLFDVHANWGAIIIQSMNANVVPDPSDEVAIAKCKFHNNQLTVMEKGSYRFFIQTPDASPVNIDTSHDADSDNGPNTGKCTLYIGKNAYINDVIIPREDGLKPWTGKVFPDCPLN